LRAAVDLTVRLVETILGWIVAAVVVVLLAIVAAQLVDRHFIDLPIHAPDQFVRVGVIWVTFVGFALAVNDGTAIRVDLIDHWLPAPVRAVQAVVFDLILLAMSLVLVVKGWTVVEVGASQYLLGTPFTAALPNTGLFVGMAATALFLAARLLRRAMALGQR